jgi:hypothetical protein|tara:strand:- start:714 stop:857 length:144 start_codon:yes stop_codon:yes gene_type:complete
MLLEATIAGSVALIIFFFWYLRDNRPDILEAIIAEETYPWEVKSEEE